MCFLSLVDDTITETGMIAIEKALEINHTVHRIKICPDHFIRVCESGDVTRAKALIERVADVNGIDAERRTALYVAYLKVLILKHKLG